MHLSQHQGGTTRRQQTHEQLNPHRPLNIESKVHIQESWEVERNYRVLGYERGEMQRRGMIEIRQANKLKLFISSSFDHPSPLSPYIFKYI